MRRLCFGMMASILLLSLLLAGCSSGGMAMKAYTSEDMGIAMDMPEKWFTKEDADQLIIANSEETLTSKEVVDGAGVFLVEVAMSDLAGMSTDPVELLTLFQESFMTSATDAELLQEATARTILEQPAATSKFKGKMDGQAGIYEVTVIVGATNVVVLLAADTTADNAFADTLTKIVDSVKLQ